MNKNHGKIIIKSMIIPLMFALPCTWAAQTLNAAQMSNKVQLIERVLLDIKTHSASLFKDNQQFTDGYHYAVNELVKAKSALAEQRLAEAEKLLEQAFLNMTYARTFLQKENPDFTLANYTKLANIVNEYSRALAETLSQHSDELAMTQFSKVS